MNVYTNEWEKSEVRFCKNCGEPIDNTAIFCPRCGVKIERISVQNQNMYIREKCNTPLVKLQQPIDLRYKYVTSFFGGRKMVQTSIHEQKKIKEAFLKVYPDSLFYDGLNEKNSILVGNNVIAKSHIEQPIDIRRIFKQTIFGNRKEIIASISEQRQIKKYILMVYPDNMFYDNLNENNSIKIPRGNKRRRGSASQNGFWDYMIVESGLNYKPDYDIDSNGDYESNLDDNSDEGWDGGFDD